MILRRVVERELLMPFASESQRRFMYSKHPRIAARWQKHTSKGKKLPEKKKETPQEKAAKFNAFQSVGGGLLSLGSKFGGKGWVNKLNRIRERAETGDEAAQRILSVLGMSSMMLGAGVGTALGSKADMPVLGGAVGAALGAAPSLISKEKKTNVLMPGFASETRAEDQMEPTMQPEKSAMARRQAFKYGFFVKVAELGLTPSEFTKAALTGPLIAAGAAGKAAGGAGETVSGAGRWGLEKALGALKLGLKTPLIVAPIAGMLLGGAYRGLTAPSYEEPEDLRHAERVGLYRRLAREALRKAHRHQQKRLSMGDSEERSLKVPELIG